MNREFLFARLKRAAIFLFAGLFMLSFLFVCLLLFLSSRGIEFYNGEILNDRIRNVLYYLIAAGAGGSLFLLAKNWPLRVGAAVFFAVALFWCAIFTGDFWNPDSAYYTFSSPDGKKSVIVEECSYLLGGWCDVYVKSGPCFVTRLKGNIRTDDGYRPFSRNDYILAWYGDSVRIDYGTGNGQRRDTETFRLK